MMFLKQNMVYCFDPTLRAQLRYQMEQFEHEFFQNKKEPVKETKQQFDRNSKPPKREGVP